MSSLGIWGIPQNDSAENLGFFDLELHLNLWNFDSNHVYLDLGVQIHLGDISSKLKELSIYCENGWIESRCIGKKVAEEKFCTTLFNEILEFQSDSNKQYKIITRQPRQEGSNSQKILVFWLLEDEVITPDKTKVIEILDLEGGHKILNIKVSELLKQISESDYDSDLYFRLRFKKRLSDLHFEKSDFKPIGIQSTFFNIYGFDFRLNEIRSLPQEIRNNLVDCLLPKISTLHFFYICNLAFQIELESQKYSACRRLEFDYWEDYLGKNIPKEPMIAFHWKKKDTDSFGLFAKFSYERRRIQLYIIFLAVAFVIGFASSLTASYSFEYLNSGKTAEDAQSQSYPSDLKEPQI